MIILHATSNGIFSIRSITEHWWMQKILNAAGTPMPAKLLFGQYFPPPNPMKMQKIRPWEGMPVHPKSTSAETNLVDLP